MIWWVRLIIISRLFSHYHSNFFEFINGYRIEEAKRLLLADEAKDDTILDIIYKSGFNSQSAFHRFFKRIVGMTPSEFRNRQRTQDASPIEKSLKRATS